jgi:hypothetical protein
MVVRRRRMTAVMVEATIMRGHIEAVAASVNALCNADYGRPHSFTVRVAYL